MPLLSSLAPAALGRPSRIHRCFVHAFSWLAAALVLFVASFALAGTWTPPPLRGHVVDQAEALTPEQARALDRKLDRARRQTGFAVVVFLLPQLPEGMSIEDVGYTAGNSWGVGSKAGDDGVLLIASLGDRKLRIETGKGVGGALTDLQSSHINREIIGPALKAGQTYEAMNLGVDAILRELVANTEGGRSDPGRDPSASRRGVGNAPPTAGDYAKLGVLLLILIGVIVLAIISPTFREILFWILLFGRFGGGGGGGSGRDSGSGYGGGGGRFGGGGSSDDY
jgi:uncharacterized protein